MFATAFRPRWVPGLLLSLAVAATLPGRAQMHHVEKPERVTRAVGVYEWTGDLAKPTAARFVPVSLFINGGFEDAGLYLARPVPFALQSGDLYELQRSGEPEGTLDLESASRVVTGNALADDNPTGAWYGFGKYTPEAAPKPAPRLHPSSHVPVIVASSESGHPHLGAKGDSKDDPDSNRPQMSRRNPSGTDAGTNTDGKKSGSSDGQGTASSTPSSTGSGSSNQRDDQDEDRPTLRRRDPSKDSTRTKDTARGKPVASVTAVGPQPGDDPDRPTLSRNTHAEQGTEPLTGLPAGMHQAVAVSDPVTREPHPFARAWEDPAEKATIIAGMASLARQAVQSYMATNGLQPSAEVLAPEAVPAPGQPPSVALPQGKTAAPAGEAADAPGAPPRLQRGKPQEYSKPAPMNASPAPAVPAPQAKANASAGVTTATRSARAARAKASSATAAAAPLRLQDEAVTGYTLSYGGLPTFVYTARVAAHKATGAENLPAALAAPVVYVTVVAQRLPSGELQPALHAVTDSGHLDRTPRLRLVDAVDPDASHRASLLFELRAGSSRQFALYRLTSAKADLTFTTASIE